MFIYLETKIFSNNGSTKNVNEYKVEVGLSNEQNGVSVIVYSKDLLVNFSKENLWEEKKKNSCVTLFFLGDDGG